MECLIRICFPLLQPHTLHLRDREMETQRRMRNKQGL
uniref:Uncharacterized protein n=1 Tax=Anguilla anguilla TaxID=7936 RepID=A0A0E9WHH2_ANGAN